MSADGRGMAKDIRPVWTEDDCDGARCAVREGEHPRRRSCGPFRSVVRGARRWGVFLRTAAYYEGRRRGRRLRSVPYRVAAVRRGAVGALPLADRRRAEHPGQPPTSGSPARRAARPAAAVGEGGRLPPLRDDYDAKLDEKQPIFVSTVSNGSDFTLVLGIEGRVNVNGFTTLELAYPDGTTVAIPTKFDGSYRFDLPTDRRDDFARAFGVLTARDPNGRPLATAPVASVAAWRARNG